MTDGLEAAREKAIAVAAWTYACDHMPVPDGFFEEIIDKAFKAGVEWAETRASESALRAAAQEAARLANDIAAHIDDLGGSGGDTVRTIARILYAALDGAPWEPSEEQVERAAMAMLVVRWEGIHPSYNQTKMLARAALKAAMGSVTST